MRTKGADFFTAFLCIIGVISRAGGVDGQNIDWCQCPSTAETDAQYGDCNVQLSAAEVRLEACRNSAPRQLGNTTGLIRDCLDIYNQDQRTDGVYNLTAFGKHARCDFSDGGWTYIFQIDASASNYFQTNWEQFKNGFGNISGNHWLGNDLLYRLTNANTYALRITYYLADGTNVVSDYSTFRVGSEASQYLLTLGDFSGTGGNTLNCFGNPQSGSGFTTADKDNDKSYTNCALEQGGGFWYNNCCSGCFMALRAFDCSTNQLYLPNEITMKIKRTALPSKF